MTEKPAPLARQRQVPELDGLRALAILPVILFHCRTVAAPQQLGEHAFRELARAGWVGVDLFFVLSGFLITGILLDGVSSPRYFSSFYIRRVLRIFPLYFAALATVSLAGRIFEISRLLPRAPLAEPAYWLFLQNWLPLFDIPWTRTLEHFWSLGIEEQFYLAWPALVLMAARRGRTSTLCIATIVVALAARWVFGRLGWEEAGNFATITRIDTLAVGALLACIVRERGLSAIRPRPLMLLMLAAASAGAAVAAFGGGFFRPTNPHIFTFAYLPLAVFFGCFLALALTAKPAGPLRSVLRSRPLTGLGRISYGVYVVHWPVVLLLERHWQSLALGFWGKHLSFLVVVTTVSVTLAAVSFRYFETRFLRLKDQLAPRPSAPAP